MMPGACCCSSPDCLRWGCQANRPQPPSQTVYHQFPDFQFMGLGAPSPKGCICPPGSEQTCQLTECGRKDRALDADQDAA